MWLRLAYDCTRGSVTVSDLFDLQRFVIAQNPVYQQACAELRNGQKRGHWMWFIFPQLRGLGRSQMAITFGIASRQEAEAYLNHPVLGPRLRECAGLVNQVEGRSIGEILGYPDDLKFRSSMTLFAMVAAGERGLDKPGSDKPGSDKPSSDKPGSDKPGLDNHVFKLALEKYFGGASDPLTSQRLD